MMDIGDPMWAEKTKSVDFSVEDHFDITKYNRVM